MAAQTVRVEGMERLEATMKKLPDDLADIAPPDAALIIGREARNRAPRRTGFLANSFKHEESDGRVSVIFDAVYAGPINYGVGPRRGKRGPHNIEATEFLTGTIRDKREEWLGPYETEVERAVERVKGA